MNLIKLLDKGPVEYRKFMLSDSFREITNNVHSLKLHAAFVKDKAQIKKGELHDLNDRYEWARIAVELYRVFEEQYDTFFPGCDVMCYIRADYVIELGHLENDEFRDVNIIIAWFYDNINKYGYDYEFLLKELPKRKPQDIDTGRLTMMVDILKMIYASNNEVLPPDVVKWLNLFEDRPENSSKRS